MGGSKKNLREGDFFFFFFICGKKKPIITHKNKNTNLITVLVNMVQAKIKITDIDIKL